MSFLSQKSASNIDVRRANQYRIFQYLLRVDKTSQTEMADRLDMSWPTVQQIIKNLLHLGLVQENGLFASTGGRKPVAISIARDSRYFIGIDVTKNHLGFVLLNLAGQCIARKRIEKEFSCDPSWFSDLSTLVSNFLKKERIALKKICGSGIALPAIIDLQNGRIPSPNALNCSDLFYDDFSNAVPGPVSLINDSDAAGYAEFWNNESIQNAVYIALNNSVGGAILLNGSLYFGQNKRSGEFGHIIVDPNGKNCYCGNRGCLDAYCNARILTDHAKGSPELFFKLLKKGDPKIKKIWDQYLDMLLFCINNLRMILDCDVILGGILGGFLSEYKMEIGEKIRKMNLFRPDSQYIQFCKYRQEASGIGAALQALDRFINEL